MSSLEASVPLLRLPEVSGVVSRHYRLRNPALPEPQTDELAEMNEEQSYPDRLPVYPSWALQLSLRTAHSLLACPSIRLRNAVLRSRSWLNPDLDLSRSHHLRASHMQNSRHQSSKMHMHRSRTTVEHRTLADRRHPVPTSWAGCHMFQSRMIRIRIHLSVDRTSSRVMNVETPSPFAASAFDGYAFGSCRGSSDRRDTAELCMYRLHRCIGRPRDFAEMECHRVPLGK